VKPRNVGKHNWCYLCICCSWCRHVARSDRRFVHIRARRNVRLPVQYWLRSDETVLSSVQQSSF